MAAASDIVFSEYVEAGPSLMVDPHRKIQASFRASPLHVTIANTIRRQVLSAVPTIGFKTEPPEVSDVHIEKNTTPLVNEMLAHRIGMIPIAVRDLSTFNPEDYEFQINVENVGRQPVNVSASDFVVIKRTDGNEVRLPTEDFFPPDPITKETALITVLRPQYNMDSPPEKLVVRAKASVDTGRTNMRFSPVAQCSYEYTRDPDPSRENAIMLNWMANSKKVPDASKLTPERLEELKREFNTLEIQRCYLQNEKGEPYDFTFHLESVGVFSVPEIIERSLQACENIVTPYTALDVELPPNVQIKRAANRMNGCFELAFQEEEHTLGNLIQTYLTERHIEGQNQPRLTYAGYKVPHPLRKEMVLIASATDGQEESVRKAIAEVCIYLKGYFASMRKTWVGTPKGEDEARQEEAMAAPVAAAAPVMEAAPAAAKRRAPTKKK